MRCHSSSGQPSGLLFQKTMGAVTTAKWNHRERKRISAAHAEAKPDTRPEEDHSQSRRARSNNGAECRDKNGTVLSRWGRFSLDIPFYRTCPISRPFG